MVSYTNLIPGKTYKLVGTLMNKDTNTALKNAEGEDITQEMELTPDEPNGSVEMRFTLDASELAGTDVVVFETLFCSQFDVPGWHENLYDPTLADAICDRIVYDSYVIRIDGDTMRKRKGILTE